MRASDGRACGAAVSGLSGAGAAETGEGAATGGGAGAPIAVSTARASMSRAFMLALHRFADRHKTGTAADRNWRWPFRVHQRPAQEPRDNRQQALRSWQLVRLQRVSA